MFEAKSTSQTYENLTVAHVHPKPSTTLTTFLFVLADYFAVAFSFVLAVAIRDLFQGQLSREMYFSLWPLLLLFPCAYYLAGLYQLGLAEPEELRRLTYATATNFAVLGAMTFLYKVGVLYSRGMFVVAFGLTLLAVPLMRALLREAFAHRPWWGRAVLILGAGKTGQLVVKNLLNQPNLGLKPIAMFDDDPEKHGLVIEGVPVIGKLSLAQKYAQKGIHYAIFAMPGLSPSRLMAVVEENARYFSHWILVPDLFGFSGLWVESKDIGGVLGLEIRQRLLMKAPQVIKRVMELSLIVVFLPLLLPLILLIAILIKLDSPGSVFFKHYRIGQEGRRIMIWKFRTMFQDAEQRLGEYLEANPDLREEWEKNQKLKDDPRITKIGRWLRKLSLDELPQLLNVIRGDMSLIGPRPIVTQEIKKYGAVYPLYCRVRPGITGLWQVSGRNDTTYDERLALDAYYVRNWSLWLDLVILAKTVRVVLTGKGAY